MLHVDARYIYDVWGMTLYVDHIQWTHRNNNGVASGKFRNRSRAHKGYIFNGGMHSNIIYVGTICMLFVQNSPIITTATCTMHTLGQSLGHRVHSQAETIRPWLYYNRDVQRVYYSIDAYNTYIFWPKALNNGSNEWQSRIPHTSYPS